MNPVGTMFEEPGVRQNTNIYQNAAATIGEEGAGRVKLPAPKPSNLPGVRPGTQFFKPPSLVSDDGGGDMQLPQTQGNGKKKFDVPNPTNMNPVTADDAIPLPPYIEQSPSPVNPVNMLFGDSTHSGSRRAEEAAHTRPVKMMGPAPVPVPETGPGPGSSTEDIKPPPVDNKVNGLTGNTAPPERRRNSVSSSVGRPTASQHQSKIRPPPSLTDGEKLVRNPASAPHSDFMQYSSTPGADGPIRTHPQSASKPPTRVPPNGRYQQSESSFSSTTSDYSDVSSSMTLMEMKASRSRIIAEVKVIQRDLSDMEVTGNTNPRELSKMRRRLGELQGILKELLLDMEVHQRSPWRQRQRHRQSQNQWSPHHGTQTVSRSKSKKGKRNHPTIRPVAVSGSVTASQQASDHQRLVDGLMRRQQSEVEAARMRYEEQIRQLQSAHRNEQCAQQQQMQREQEKLFEYEQAVAKAGALKQQFQLAQADVIKNETALHSASLMFNPRDRHNEPYQDGLPQYSGPHYHRAVSPSYHAPIQSSPIRGRPDR
eukprot:TRINITY_DN33746_c0_g1_i1.p1 TRINITY_DN33746_c0_g1~~TRINITY_DN33746_c0_g1_i1.p1  ORF type:complete len:539 (+),score=98.20 TRINITY_DN33746_c0_g1_i1:85-1701(+)